MWNRDNCYQETTGINKTPYRIFPEYQSKIETNTSHISMKQKGDVRQQIWTLLYVTLRHCLY